MKTPPDADVETDIDMDIDMGEGEGEAGEAVVPEAEVEAAEAEVEAVEAEVEAVEAEVEVEAVEAEDEAEDDAEVEAAGTGTEAAVATGEAESPLEAEAASGEDLSEVAVEESSDEPEIEFDGAVHVDIDASSEDAIELDDIEELDDIDMVEEPPAPAAAASPPPTPATPPPTPPPTPGPPPPPGAAVEDSADDGAVGEADDGRADGEAAAAPEPAPAFEQQIEMPTVLDRYLAEVEEESWEPRAQQLAAELETATDKGQIALIAYELGEVYQKRLADEARAVKAYGKALQADPSYRPNLWAIRRVFYRRGLWPNLIKLLDAEIRFARDDSERADLHLEKGHVLEDRLAKLDEAKEAYGKAVALDPASTNALLSLERLALRDHDEELLERLWRALADAANSPARKVTYLLDLVRLYRLRNQEGDLDRARELIAEAVALAAPAGARAVANERELIAELANDPAELITVLEGRIAGLLAEYGPAGPEAVPAEARAPGSELDREAELRLQIVALRRRQARIARQADNPGRAWDYLEQALALAGGEPLVLADLADVAEQLGKFAELAELCQGWESLEGDPARSLSLSIRRADALLRGGQRDQANALLDSLASGAPGYLPITALRERDALAEGDWAGLAATQIASAEAALLGTSFGPGVERPADQGGAAALFVAAGDLYAFYLGNSEEAATSYGRALEAVAGYPPAVEALTMLHEQTGKLAEATELLELHSEVGDSDYQVEILERLARLYADLGRDDDALSTLRRLLAADPDSVRLRWRLEGALASQGKIAERVAVLIELSELLSDPSQQASVLLDAARACDGDLDAPDRAIELYRKVLEIWPNDSISRTALGSLLRRAERWDDLVAERRSEAALLDDGPALTGALREAAALLREPLGRPAEAAAVYRELLDRVPDEPFALRGLAEALQESGDFEALADALAAEAETREDPQLRSFALLRLATTYERLGRPDDALETYRRVLELTPKSTIATTSMVELAARGVEPATMVDTLTALAEQRSDPALRSEILEEVGWLWAFALQDYDRAADAFAEASAADPRRRGPLLGAALVHAKRAAAADTGDALTALAESVHEVYAASSMLLRAAAIAEVSGYPEVASQRVARAAVIAPDDAGTLMVASEYLPAGATDELPAEGAGEHLLRRANLYGMRAKLATDVTARDDWNLDRAEALEGAGRLREAGEIVAEILRARPDDVRALQTLRRLCQRAGDRNSLARASLALGLIIGDREGTLELLREAATIFDSEDGDSERAVLVYRRILAEDGGAPEYGRLSAIYASHDDSGGLVELISDRLNHLSQDDDPLAERASVPLLMDRAGLRRKLGDAAGATRDLTRLLTIDENHTKALSTQAELILGSGDATGAAELLRRFLDIEMEPELRANAELLLSQILADMQDLDGAIEQLEHVVEQSPDDLAVRERLVAIVIQSGDWQRAVSEIREVERLRAAANERANDELRVAAIFRDRLDDVDKARAALERARQLDPLHVDAIRELAELNVGDVSERKRVLEHAASDIRQAIDDEPTRPALYQRLANVAEWLGDDDARFFAVGGLAAVGSLGAQDKQFYSDYLSSRDDDELFPKKMLEEDDWRARLSHPQAGGFANDLWQVLVEAAAKGTGLDAGQLGFARNHKVSPKQVDKSFPRLAQVMRAFAIGNYELYVSETKSGYARVVNISKPGVFLSADVARGGTPEARFALARAVAQVRDGTGTLAELRDAEVLVLFAAAAMEAGVSPPPPALAEVTSGASAEEVKERARTLHRQMSRRDRKNLALVQSRFSQLGDPLLWRRAALSTSARAGLLLGSDIAAALDVLDVGRGGRSVLDDKPALDLLAWAVGDDHMALRAQLGLKRGA